ncbi:MAG: hypothetical protein ABIM89_09810 [Mycobacteriales bacterium]
MVTTGATSTTVSAAATSLRLSGVAPDSGIRVAVAAVSVGGAGLPAVEYA